MSVTCPTELPQAEYLRLFDPSVRDAVRASLQRPGVAAAICYEVLDMCSSQHGRRTSMICGPGCTYTLEQGLSHRLGDVPSRFAYPIHYTVVPTTED